MKLYVETNKIYFSETDTVCPKVTQLPQIVLNCIYVKFQKFNSRIGT